MKEPKFKTGDQVVMHSCPDAEKPENKGIIFTCKKDGYIFGDGSGELVTLNGFGSINANFLVSVYPDKIRKPETYQLQKIEVKEVDVSEVIAELSRRGIMFIQTKSDDSGFQTIYFKADNEVAIHIMYEIL